MRVLYKYRFPVQISIHHVNGTVVYTENLNDLLEKPTDTDVFMTDGYDTYS